ncbi:hypothetical protein H4582DRAFT_2056714 [Lactarius indigo]|nr:hypothetical protein H4582DRAFT_2056714 [Lactarius indigo]
MPTAFSPQRAASTRPLQARRPSHTFTALTRTIMLQDLAGSLQRLVYAGTPNVLQDLMSKSGIRGIIAAEAIEPSGLTRVVKMEIKDIWVSGHAFFKPRCSLTSTRPHLLVGAREVAGCYRHQAISSPTRRHSLTVLGEGIIWGGRTYETANGKVAETLAAEVVPGVSQGIEICDTEVVLSKFF